MPQFSLDSDRFDALLSRRCARIPCGPGDRAPTGLILPGSFNPLHSGHCQMAAVANELCGEPVALELSIANVDKRPLQRSEVERRVRQVGGLPLWLTQAPTFVEKSALFPGAVFLVGIDTLLRIADPAYYAAQGDSPAEAVNAIAEAGCSFLVFGRLVDGQFCHVRDLALPDDLNRICRTVPEAVFRRDISSTELRQQ